MSSDRASFPLHLPLPLLLSPLLLLPLSAQPGNPSSDDLNLARGFSGASILRRDPTSGSLVSEPGLLAIIDDDASSGWTPPVGHSELVVNLAQAAELNSLTVFAPNAEGSYKIYVADSADALASDHRQLLASGSLASPQKQRLPETPGAVIAVELEVQRSAPMRGLNLGGVVRGFPSVVSVVAPKAGEGGESSKEEGEVAEVNFALKLLGGEVAASELQDAAAQVALIDGDTSTSSMLEPDDDNHSGTTIRLASAIDIDRITLAVDFAEGDLRISTTDEESGEGRELVTTSLDGTSEVLAFSTNGVRASHVRINWTPSAPGTALTVKEVGVFALARIERTVADARVAAARVTVVPTLSTSSAISTSSPLTPSPTTTQEEDEGADDASTVQQTVADAPAESITPTDLPVIEVETPPETELVQPRPVSS